MAPRPTIRRREHSGRESALAPEDVDAILLNQAEVGNTLAFERIAWRYDEVILGFFLMLTSSEQEALELCRATFVAAYQDLARRNTESLYIWLYRLAAAQWLARGGGKLRPAAGAPELSAREQLVFTLRAGQHLALRTIAQILDVPADTVAETFCRAVCKLRIAGEARRRSN